ncbi:hypothetical protein V1511DRAFT_515505 [Dipodascopsis uninucleata]
MNHYKFSLRSHRAEDLPSSDDIIQSARIIVDNVTNSWTRSRYFSENKVTTYKTLLNGETWFARVSEHSESYDMFRKGIFENHSINELSYIPLLKDIRFVDGAPSGWQGIVATYSMPGPLKEREFPEWLYAVEPDPNIHEFFIISIPAQLEVSKSAVRARYVAIEQIKEMPNGKFQWIAAQVSDAGGILPRWIQDLSIERVIATDVGHYLTWAEKNFNSEQP